MSSSDNAQTPMHTPANSRPRHNRITPHPTPSRYKNPTLDPYYQDTSRWNTIGTHKLMDQELTAILWMTKYGPDKNTTSRKDWVQEEREKRGLAMPLVNSVESKMMFMTRPWKNGIKEYARRHYASDTQNPEHFSFYWNDTFIEAKTKTPLMYELRGILLDTDLFFWESVEWLADIGSYKARGAGKNKSKYISQSQKQ